MRHQLTISFFYRKEHLEAIYAHNEPGPSVDVIRTVVYGIFFALIGAMTAWAFTRERGQEKSSVILAAIFAGAVLLVVLTRLALTARARHIKKIATMNWIDSLVGVKVTITCNESGLTFSQGDTTTVTEWPDLDYMENEQFILLFSLENNYVLPAIAIPMQQYDALREWIDTHIDFLPAEGI